MTLQKLFVLSAFAARALQSSTVEGTVFDRTGAAVAGAEITLTSRKTAAGPDGRFQFEDIPPGKYVLAVKKPGFEPAERTVLVSEDAPGRVSVTLDAANLRQTVTVTESVGYSVATVTSATKTAASMLDIPQSVDAVNRETLEAQAALSMQDALRNVSGVSFALGEGRRDQVYIRGFSANTDQFIDGVRDDGLFYRDLSNIQEVEVVKGPAAVLFGRGSSGGLVNRITKKPDFERPLGELTLIAGSYGAKRIETDLGQVFLNGALAGRLTGAYEDSGSSRNFFYLNRYAFSPSLAWKPGDRTNIVASFDYLRDGRLPDRGIPSWNGFPAPVAVGQYYGYPQDDYLRNRVAGAALTAEHRLRENWTIRNVFRRTGYANDFSNTYANGLNVIAGQPVVPRGQYNATRNQANLFDQVETAASGAFLGLRHTVLFGVEVGRQDLATVMFTGTADPVALYNPFLTHPFYSASPSTFNDFRGNTLGTYVQDQISWRRWKALFGVRRDRYAQSLDNSLPSNPNLARADNAWSPRAGLVYSITNWMSAYASVSKTFDPSGEALSLATNNADLKPERTRNLELGLKRELFGGRLRTTVAAFRLDRTNVKTADPVNPLLLVLVGAQRTDGVELSVSGRVWRRLEVIGGYARLDPVILRSNTVTSGVLLQGAQAGLVARQSANLWATYSWENGFGVSAGVYATARRFTSNDDLVVLPGYARVDASIFYRFGRWSLSLNAKNLFNRAYYETAQSDYQIYPGSPVNGLLTLRYR